MEPISMNFNYRGAKIEALIYPDEDCRGALYAVELNGNYVLTFYANEDTDFGVLRESNGTTPFMEAELMNKILKNLKWQLNNAA